MLRKCTKCGEEKDVTRFVRQRGKYRSDPYRRDCKDCKNGKRRKGTPCYSFPEGHTPWNKGIPATEEHRENVRLGHLGQIAHNKGIRNSEKRFSRKYKEWSNAVRTRDGKCQKCDSEKDLHAHHIKPWKEDETLRFDIENGMTLCRSCHAKEEGYQKGHIPKKKGVKKHA